jgi:hypothetical protein
MILLLVLVAFVLFFSYCVALGLEYATEEEEEVKFNFTDKKAPKAHLWKTK